LFIRKAEHKDLSSILAIYNQGIEDGMATLEEEAKDSAYMENWFVQHQGRYAALVAENDEGVIVGWAAINPFHSRCAYKGVGELSVYVHRTHRGKKIGQLLLQALEKTAVEQQFYKLILYTFPMNAQGQGLYRKMNFRQVGIWKHQGKLRGKYVDIMIMEKLLMEESFYTN